MHWNKDTFMFDSEPRQCNLLMAIFLRHLALGETITHRQIRAGTMKQYLLAIAKITKFHRADGLDPRMTTPSDTSLCPMITAIPKEVIRHENMPNKRNPYTVVLLQHRQRKAKLDDPTQNFFGLDATLADTFECGLFTGGTLTEYAQPHQNL